jgi:hypothetical protein
MFKTLTVIACSIALILTINGCTSQNSILKAKHEVTIVKQVAIACMMYSMDNNDMLPTKVEDLRKQLTPTFDLSNIELLQQGKITDIANPGQVKLLRSTKELYDDKEAVAFVDGHAKLLPKK